ncbi:beta-fructosidase [Halanaerocella petrolearia]
MEEKILISLVRVRDKKELFKATGRNREDYRRVYWNASEYIGEECYIKVVDRAQGGWGHINVDNINVPIEESKVSNLTAIKLSKPDFEFSSDKIKELYNSGPYRPQYHFSTPQSAINVPNGLIHWQGDYHLFYQSSFNSVTWGPTDWGHAVSKDLVHWQHLPTALALEETDNMGDMSGIFSGSVVNNRGELTLIYTKFTDPRAHPNKMPETQAIATSQDGIRFKKYKGNPVIDKLPAKASPQFRDPNVWKDKDGLWKMILGSGYNDKGILHLYSSPNLKEWTYLGILFKEDKTNSSRWITPDFFSIRDKSIIFVTVNGNRQTTLYFVGKYKNNKFIPETSGRVDFGPDFYAAQTFKDTKGRRIMIGWMDSWEGAKLTKKSGWLGAMSLPRKLFLFPNGDLGSKPIAELKQLRATKRPKYHFEDLKITSKQSGYLSNIKGDTLEIKAKFKINAFNFNKFGIELRKSPQENEETIIAYNPKTEELIINRNKSGIGNRGIYQTDLKLIDNNTVKFHIYLDRSSVEVFANDGRATGSARIYPHWEESLGLDLFIENGSVTLKSIDIWKLESAWKK